MVLTGLVIELPPPWKSNHRVEAPTFTGINGQRDVVEGWTRNL